MRAAATLTRCCAVIGSVKDGRAALVAAEALQPDVIVVDISMPGMNGLELAHHLREAGSKAAIVILTIHEEMDLVAAAQAAGAIGYVVKRRLAADLAPAVCAAREGRLFVSSIH
jgi:DNA-binding NarL/FixJ family response regulator